MTNLLVELNHPFRERLIQKVPDLMPPKEKRCLAILFRQSLDVASHARWNGHQKVIICIKDFAATPSHPIGDKPASFPVSSRSGRCVTLFDSSEFRAKHISEVHLLLQQTRLYGLKSILNVWHHQDARAL